MMFDLQALPYELQLVVLQKMHFRSVLRTAATSRRFYQLVRQNINVLPRPVISGFKLCCKPSFKVIFQRAKYEKTASSRGEFSCESSDEVIRWLCHVRVRECIFVDVDVDLLRKLGESRWNKSFLLSLSMASINKDVKFSDLRWFLGLFPSIKDLRFRFFTLEGNLGDLIRDVPLFRAITLYEGDGLSIDDETLKVIAAKSSPTNRFFFLEICCNHHGHITLEGLIHFMENVYAFKNSFLDLPFLRGDRNEIIDRLRLTESTYFNSPVRALPENYTRKDKTTFCLSVHKLI